MTAPKRQTNELVERLQTAASRLRDQARMDDRAAAGTRNDDATSTFRAWAIGKRELADDIEFLLPMAAIFLEDTPTLAARLISELDTDESESPVDYRPGDYKPRVEVAKYVIGRIKGEVE